MSVRAVEAGGVALCVEDLGAGGPVVLVHGTATARSVWRELTGALAGEVRTLAYDRRAYGDSGAPEPYGGTTVGEQADDLAELIGSLDVAPAVVCGHDLGALITLDTAVRHPALVRAALVVETPMLWLSARGPDVVAEIRAAVELGARDGGPGGAVEAFLAAVAGPDANALGPERLAEAKRDARAFAADLAAVASWPAGRRELRSIAAPVTVVTGARSAPIYGEVATKLAELVREASLEVLDSGHFPQLTHPDRLAELIRNASF